MNVGVIFAGGIGTRMNARAVPKQFLEVHGKPIIIHTLEHFENHPDISAIAVAILAEWRDELTKALNRYEITKVRWIVDGGETGQISRHRALQAVAADCPPQTVVLIHDGVRPLITAGLISENIESVVLHGSAITCTKFHETLISAPSRQVGQVIPRDHLYAAQAPQEFRLGEVLQAYEQAVSDGESNSIDSCTLVHRYGLPVHRVLGPRSNIKVTSPEDFYICRTFFEIIENRQIEGF